MYSDGAKRVGLLALYWFEWVLDEAVKWNWAVTEAAGFQTWTPVRHLETIETEESATSLTENTKSSKVLLYGSLDREDDITTDRFNFFLSAPLKEGLSTRVLFLTSERYGRRINVSDWRDLIHRDSASKSKSAASR